MATFVEQLKMVIVHCCNCGMPFALTQDFKDRRVEDAETFYCPKGHPQHFGSSKTKQQEIEDLKKEVARQRINNTHLRETRDHYQNRMNGYKGHVTRVKNAIAKGKCPCCNEYFDDLHNHMKTKHPQFQEQES